MPPENFRNFGAAALSKTYWKLCAKCLITRCFKYTVNIPLCVMTHVCLFFFFCIPGLFAWCGQSISSIHVAVPIASIHLLTLIISAHNGNSWYMHAFTQPQTKRWTLMAWLCYVISHHNCTMYLHSHKHSIIYTSCCHGSLWLCMCSKFSFHKQCHPVSVCDHICYCCLSHMVVISSMWPIPVLR